MPESDGLRLFFALWPDDDLRARVAHETAAALADSSGRVIPPDNLHVTLLFLGHTPRVRLPQITAAAAHVRGPRFQIVFDRIETWARSHIVCLTSSTPPREAGELADALATQLADLVRRDDREFRPHVTLARDATRKLRTRAIAPIEWPARDLALVESNMTRTGSHYAVLERWPLAS
jgi:RNA 2',3'-cyclic 3'-phosphodiesterase